MQKGPVDRVVIVGGGTSGWMTAAYFNAAFGDRVSVTLVESKVVPSIGVGEATFSTVRKYFEYLGLEEEEWMPEVNGTYKFGIRYENWNKPGEHFLHPFERQHTVDGFPLTDWWLQSGRTSRFDTDCFVMASMCDAQRSPRYLSGALLDQNPDQKPARSEPRRSTMTDQDTQFPYAYHFDAALLARFLTKFATNRGVRHVVDDVVDVQLDSDGFIARIVTKESGEVEGDLFIDCTGFRGMLINKALEVPFVSYQDTLPNDRAVALRVPTDMAVNGLRPYTRATAQDAGWIWTIPLFERIGTGYVYASDYVSADQAEQTLRDFVGPAADDLEANHIRMRIGRSESSWVKNCVAIGLSSGFVEPLESTGIFFIQHAIEQLVQHFPADRGDDRLPVAYNRLVANVMDGVREFLVMHYYAAGRRDNQYWRDAKIRPLPDALAERMEQWKVRLPDKETIFPRYHGFEQYSYAAMLLGLGGLPLQASPVLSKLDMKSAELEFERIQRQTSDLVASLPSQYEYLTQLHRSRQG